jgi:hypothetical protein
MDEACGMYGKTQVAYRVLTENLIARDHLDNLGTYGKIMSKRIFKILDGTTWTRFISFRIWKSGMLL